MALRWGICSTAKTSHDFAKAIQSFPEEEHIITAIASMDNEKSQEFSRTYQIPNAYANYEALSEDRDVDIVYVGVINPNHFEVTKTMLSGYKHVVCEKPLCINEKHAKELMILAKIKKVLLMEALWTRCFPAIEHLTNSLSEGVIGEILYVQITFGRCNYNDHNLNLRDMGRGSVLDFGPYVLSFQELIFKNMTPSKIITTGHLNQQDIDESATAVFNYYPSVTVIVSIHSRCELSNEVVIVGTLGSVRIPHFLFPTKLIFDNETSYFPLPNEAKVANRFVAFIYLIEEVSKCMSKGLLESEKVPHTSTLSVMHWMDTWRKQMEVMYQEDDT